MKYQLLWLFCFVPFVLSAQNLHERTWFFGMGHSLYFDNGVVKAGGIPLPVNTNDYYINSGNNLFNIAASDNSDDLQFFVQIKSFGVSPAHLIPDYINIGYKIFDRLGNPFSNGNIKAHGRASNTHISGNPVIIPFPGSAERYFIFYTQDNSLRYSIINMDLNAGFGDVETAFKDIVLTGFGTVIGYKMIAAPSCEGMWLIVKTAFDNQYLSYKIDDEGIDTVPVISNASNIQISQHQGLGHYLPFLKISNDGKLIGASTASGIELYDFEPCSGRLKNARIIDTLPAYGLCFSPDDSKLYASYNKPFFPFYQGEIYQYDMRSDDPATIAASRTLVMRNPIYQVWTPLGPIYFVGAFGELKIGLDGKMYVSKNNYIENDSASNCNVYYPGPDRDPVPLPSSNYCRGGQFMHVIHEPDRPGMACNPELNYLKLTDSDRRPGLLLQSDIKVAPTHPPDTIQGGTVDILVCFRNEEVLTVNEEGACYTWDDGGMERTRTVKESGTYLVSYFKDCSHQTDTFRVNFIPLPDVPKLVYGCRGEIEIVIKSQDTALLAYTLEKRDSDLSYTAESRQGHIFNGLSGGDYTLRIQSTGGCDTTLHIQLEEYPSPEVTVDPTDVTIRYGDTLQLFAEGAQSYVWHPPHAVDRHDIPNPITYPLQPIQLFVVGTNAYGCKDTGYVNIDIDYTMPDLIPNAFSPNGDGLNDVFKVEGITYQRILAFKVFNRFGQLVFSTTDPDKGWDGTYKGQSCEVGTYYYLVQLAYPDGRERVFKGDVVLLR